MPGTTFVGIFTALIILFHDAASYGRLYPVTGTWFKDRIDVNDLKKTLTEFQSTGGDTALTRGAKFLNTTADGVKKAPLFSDCIEDGKHCVDIAKQEFKTKGLDIQAWVTYSYEENYTDAFVVCDGFDKRYQIGKLVYYRLVLWTEEYMGGEDCTFKNGSKVAVVFTSYKGEGDPHQLLIEQADAMNISVYVGLPYPPHLGEDQASADLMQAFYSLNYRVMHDHQRKYSKISAMKGYYSSVTVVPDYITNVQKVRPEGPLPPQYTVMFWRELGFLSGNFGFELIGSPTIDLTHAGNTTLEGYRTGLESLRYFGMLKYFVIMDGRGEGKAAYYSSRDKDKKVKYTDYSLWEVLKHKNSSITDDVKFSDVYYASIGDFFRYYNDLKIPTWLMIEAYDDTGSKDVCQPVDPKGSGMDRKVERVFKSRLDQALTHVGSLVSKVTAFAWDPLYTCTTKGFASLAEQIVRDHQRPIISECRFHSQQNQSIVLIGFNIDGPITQPFQVNYTMESGKHKSISLYGYYYELDYGKQHGLVDSLVYVQLYDIPNLRDIKKHGVIGVARTDGTGEGCYFNYTLNQAGENLHRINIKEADDVVYG